MDVEVVVVVLGGHVPWEEAHPPWVAAHVQWEEVVRGPWAAEPPPWVAEPPPWAAEPLPCAAELPPWPWAAALRPCVGPLWPSLLWCNLSATAAAVATTARDLAWSWLKPPLWASPQALWLAPPPRLPPVRATKRTW